jgi:YHS domain-containing protein
MTSKTRIAAGALLALGAVMAFHTQPALGDPTFDRLHQDHDLLGQSIGLVGYDPVSYFPAGGGQAAKGLISISAEHAGVTYRFATEEHKAAFLESPEKYLPAFGGWCTWAMGALGKRVDVDPESYVVKNGRLLVFYRDPKLETRALFLENPDELLAKADANWAVLSK